MNIRCEDLMTRHPRCCNAGDNLLDAIRIMKEVNVGFVPVCDANGERLVGVVTDRDIAMALSNDEKPSAYRLENVMSRDPITVRPDDDAMTCARVMEDAQVRRVPVVDRDQKLLGVISLADVARKAVSRKELESELGSIVERVSQPSTSV
jgi:CBS domain-containing protein